MTSKSRVWRTICVGARRAAAWPFRVAAARAALRTLANMDRRELADIGLNPSDVRDASALPLDRDPTALLAARARERQANAFAAPPSAWDGGWTDEDRNDEPRRNPPSPGSRAGAVRTFAARTG
jgi:uncharacterized protein YjiS (DUF1127 family)